MKPNSPNGPDFDKTLPEGREYFSVRQLAKMWGIAERTVMRLIDDGSLEIAVNMAPAGSKHSLARIHRSSVVKFLQGRNGG
jgi:hypothetical protein